MAQSSRRRKIEKVSETILGGKGVAKLAPTPFDTRKKGQVHLSIVKSRQTNLPANVVRLLRERVVKP